MKRSLILLALLPCLSLAGDEWDSLDAVIKAFVDQPGYEQQAVEPLLDQLEARLSSDPTSMFPAGSGLGPLTRGLLMVETSANDSQPVRYRLRYGEVRLPQPPKATALTVGLVEIQRFDLGPAWRAELARIHGDAAASEESTPVHQAWRLVTRPIQGQAALPEAVGERQMSTAEAEREDCLGLPCTSLDMLDQIDEPEWREVAPPALPDQAPYVVLADQVPSAAALVDMALGEIGAVSIVDQVDWRGFEPREGAAEGAFFLEIVVERGLAPESRAAVLLREDDLMDHLVQTQWVRIDAVAAGSDQPPLLRAMRAEERWPRTEMEP